MTLVRYVEHASPVGPLRIAASPDGLVAVHMRSQKHMPEEPHPAWQRLSDRDAGAAAAAHVAAAQEQLDEYFAGRRRTFELSFAAAGTDFQHQVWRGLETIPFGETLSYAGLARRIGKPKAMRAVGLANGRNPLSIVVPCHRVIGANGTMTGYGGGLERKVFLLALEAGPSALESLPRSAAVRAEHRLPGI